MPRSLRPFAALLAAAVLLAGCDVFGSKDDATTDEIFDQGASDPTLAEDVGYVTLTPFFTQAQGGDLDRPLDVAVGFDRYLYVPDANGLQVLDLAGRPQFALTELAGQPVRFARRAGTPGDAAPQTAVVQDLRLDVYLAARRDTTIDGRTWDLPVVYRLRGLTTGNPRLMDIIWHPFDDLSRAAVSRFRNPSDQFRDEEVSFVGIGVRPDNSVYVARRGELNAAAELPQGLFAQNAVLSFTAGGVNLGNLGNALSATQPSLRSVVAPSDLITYVQPNESQTPPTQSADFLVAQNPAEAIPFSVLSIRVVESPLGTEYQPDTQKLAQAGNPDAGDDFLYRQFRFEDPTDLAFAADGTNYLFVVDAGKDSLFVFNQNGVEGVRPPAASGSTRPVRVSFGGTGAGPLQLRDPQGVTYFDRTVYVADTGNNRVGRYRLNTDFE